MKKTLTPWECEYRGTCLRIGVMLLCFEVILLTTTLVDTFIQSYLLSFGEQWSYAVSELISDAFYLFSFMFPVAIFTWISRGRKTEPIPFSPQLPGRLPLLVLAAISINYAMAFLNSQMLSFIHYSDFSSQQLWATDITNNYQLILAMIGTALVPAFCEEFLFRGCIFSNLKKYNKNVAIFGSALLFGLMHGNAEQFLYTTALGVVLAWICAETGNIWCGVLIHFFNNFFSVLEEAVSARFAEATAEIINTGILIFLTVGGAVSLVLLLLRAAQKKESKKTEALPDLYGEPVPLPLQKEGNMISVSAMRRGFFNPTILAFTAFSVGEMLLLILMAIFF